ncbi:hypothetical protein [Aeromonas phage 4L372XY]|uniref:Uncharacterized protein n=1 Tax=Aeromonas phage 4L372XY TaxID=2588520 RepID=A0A5B9ND03_9CAUD|nr:hypothetical protein HWC28_gp018 [Aeromonas phage 4L372XY]QEG08733.1 hypothetical protein [Aeromonas phage 4L372XY]
MKHVFNCSAFVESVSNKDAFINREIIATDIEEAQQKFNMILENYQFVSVDFDSISVKIN